MLYVTISYTYKLYLLNGKFQLHNEFITQENTEFIKEVVRDQVNNAESKSKEISTNTIEWRPDLKRTGVIAKKIGVYPLWLKNGEKIMTTLLQVHNTYSGMCNCFNS